MSNPSVFKAIPFAKILSALSLLATLAAGGHALAQEEETRRQAQPPGQEYRVAWRFRQRARDRSADAPSEPARQQRSPLSAQAAEVVHRWADAYRNARTIQYVSVFTYAGKKAGDPPQKVTIKFWARKPNFIRAEVNTTSDPDESGIMVSDGKIITEYCPATNQFMETPVPDAPFLMQGELAGLRYVYTSLFFHPDPYRALVQGTTSITLQPQTSKRSPYTTVVRRHAEGFNIVWLHNSDNLPRRSIVYSIKGAEVREIVREERKRIAVNLPLEEKLFAIKVPNDAQRVPSGGAMESLLKTGGSAPDFTVRDANGKKARFNDLRGKIVVLTFWASWCPPCDAELPELQKLLEEPANKNVVALALNSWDHADAIRDYEEDHPDSALLLWRDPQSVREKSVAYSLYGVRGLPTTYLIGPDGKIAQGWIGYDNERLDELRSALAKLRKSQK